MKKYVFITTPVIMALLLLLRYFNILKGAYGEPIYILLVGLILSTFFAYIERNVQRNENIKDVNYENLDLARFLFAIVVLLVHMRPFLGYNDPLDIATNYIVGRVCVPLYFISTGYFCAKKEKLNTNYTRTYLKNTVYIYILWSILYLPLGLYVLQQSEFAVPTYLLPFAPFVGFFYIGTYYHLWYFPALILALVVLRFWIKKFPIRVLVFIAFILLLFGASETYFGILPEPVQQFLSTYYFKIFITTRNFLFFGLFYVSLGYVIGAKQNSYVPYCFLKFLLCCGLLIAEALVLQAYDRLDSNILLSCVPLVYYLFITLIHTKPLIKFKKAPPFRTYYKYYYLLHPFVIFISAPIFLHYDRFEGHYWLQIIIVLVYVHLFTVLILRFKKKYPRALRYL